MRLRRDGVCACGVALPMGTRAGWDRVDRLVVCEPCLALESLQRSSVVESAPVFEPAVVPIATAVHASDAGASLRREADRRAAKREESVRARFPRVGGLLLAIAGEPASTQSLRVGAAGERKAAERILGRCGEDVLFLLNRRLGIGRRNGDIDMLAVTAQGVHVIDVKHFKGAKVEVRKSGGLFVSRTESLWIGGRNRTQLLESMGRQLEAVEAALHSVDPSKRIEITGTLCFVDANLPLLGTLRVRGVEIRGSREMGRKLRATKGPLSVSERRVIYEQLAVALPAA